MLVHSISQLLTLQGDPQRGSDLGRLGLIEDAAVLIREGLVQEIGRSSDFLQRYPREPRLDAGGCAVLPGFVDPHTHLLFAGDRAQEFELRLQGKDYMTILAAGGGILSTVRATRNATTSELTELLRLRARTLLRYGSTTLEVKTGYGLNLETEMKQLWVIADYADEQSPDLFPTFLAAHAVPPEYPSDPSGYIQLIWSEMLPRVKTEWGKRYSRRSLPFVDVFCERGAFDLEQSRTLLGAARELGFGLKIHVDEFENLGGAALAADLGAVSADHLVKTSSNEIRTLAASKTVAVSLPCTPFGLGMQEYTPAREFLAAGGVLALASDFNPGTAWCGNMQFTIALACRYLHLTPAEAIAAATINAAAAIGEEQHVGSIEPGKKAHLLILRTPDYRQLGYRFGGNLVGTIIKDRNIIHNTEGC